MHEGDDGGFGGGIIGGTGVGAEAGDGGSGDDGARGIWFGRRGTLHGERSVFGR